MNKTEAPVLRPILLVLCGIFMVGCVGVLSHIADTPQGGVLSELIASEQKHLRSFPNDVYHHRQLIRWLNTKSERSRSYEDLLATEKAITAYLMLSPDDAKMEDKRREVHALRVRIPFRKSNSSNRP